MEDKGPGLMSGNQIRETFALAVIVLFLIVGSYLLTAFIMQVVPFPFGSLEDFSACCSGLQAHHISLEQ